jgi:hypothetical protein
MVYDVQGAVIQLYPGLSVAECTAWLDWVGTQPDYYINSIGSAVCITKVYNQSDPPWLRVAHEVAWWGTGRDAVRVLHRGMDWARLKGATHYGYSIAPHLDIVKWRVL